MDPLLKIFPLVKVDEAAHMVWGIVTSETPDSDDEICDYPAAKAAIAKWSDETLAKTTAAGQDPSLGNMRVMHQLEVGGKAFKIEYHDDTKQIWVGSEPANDEVWHLLKGGFLTGHSIGGGYAWKKADGNYVRYAPTIGEISYVDRGANPDASFAYVKADGSTELRKFAKPGPRETELLAKMKGAAIGSLSDADVARIAKALGDSIAQKGVKYLVPEGQHLPYTDESGKPSHSHMGAAWAALHGGYRGNKYEGPGKEQAIAHLKEIYRSEGMEPPSEKCAALITELSKTIEFCGDSGLDTELTKFSALLGDLMRKQSPARTAMKMTAEQLKKCADALGMKPEEFSKLCADTVVGEPLEKAKHGIAALHSHLETAMAHHDGMMKAHEAMSGMHEKMSGHLGKCMKACKAVMGDDEKEAEKAIKALVEEMTKGAPTETPEAKAAREALEKSQKEGTVSKADVQSLIDEAVKKAVGNLPAPQTTPLFVVDRNSGDVKKAEKSGDPYGAAR